MDNDNDKPNSVPEWDRLGPEFSAAFSEMLHAPDVSSHIMECVMNERHEWATGDDRSGASVLAQTLSQELDAMMDFDISSSIMSAIEHEASLTTGVLNGTEDLAVDWQALMALMDGEASSEETAVALSLLQREQHASTLVRTSLKLKETLPAFVTTDLTRALQQNIQAISVQNESLVHSVAKNQVKRTPQKASVRTWWRFVFPSVAVAACLVVALALPRKNTVHVADGVHASTGPALNNPASNESDLSESGALFAFVEAAPVAPSHFGPSWDVLTGSEPSDSQLSSAGQRGAEQSGAQANGPAQQPDRDVASSAFGVLANNHAVVEELESSASRAMVFETEKHRMTVIWVDSGVETEEPV